MFDYVNMGISFFLIFLMIMIKIFFFIEYCMNDCMFICVCINYIKCKIIIISDSIEDMECLWILCICFLCVIVYSVGRIKVNCFICFIVVYFNFRILIKKK